MLHMEVDKEEVGDALLSGSLTRFAACIFASRMSGVSILPRQTSMSSAVNEVKTHMANIGRLVGWRTSDY
jgi:hypothetical protein